MRAPKTKLNTSSKRREKESKVRSIIPYCFRPAPVISQVQLYTALERQSTRVGRMIGRYTAHPRLARPERRGRGSGCVQFLQSLDKIRHPAERNWTHSREYLYFMQLWDVACALRIGICTPLLPLGRCLCA